MKTSLNIIIVIIFLGAILFNKKMNLLKIVCGHCKTLYNNKTGKFSWGDFATFIIMPIILAVVLICCYDVRVNEIAELLTVFSIFTALLFNFLIIVINGKRSSFEDANADTQTENKKRKVDENRKIVYNETYYNTSFAILISIFLIVLLMLHPYLKSIKFEEVDQNLVIAIVDAMIISMSITFILTLFMILKRVFSLFNIRGADQ